MHFGAPALKERFFSRIPARLLGSPGVTGVDATVAAWDDGQPWLDEILAQLQANRDWLAETIAAELPGVTMRVPEATYLAWLDCRALELPGSAGQFFLDQARVGLNFGETFGARLCRLRAAEFRDAAASAAGDRGADGGGGAEAVREAARTVRQPRALEQASAHTLRGKFVQQRFRGA